MAEKYQMISSDIRRGEAITGIWRLKDWNKYDNFKYLSSTASCGIRIEIVNGGRIYSEPRFSFNEHSVNTKRFDSKSLQNIITETVWLSLNVRGLSSDRIFKYDIAVDTLNDDLKVVTMKETSSVNKSMLKADLSYGTATLKSQFIKVQERVIQKGKSSVSEQPTIFSRPSNLRLKISLTPYYVSEDSEIIDKPKSPEESITEAIENTFADKQHYADIKLKMKDGVTLSAYKFLLAARSPIIREFIEKEMDRFDFDGAIQLDVSSVPMMTILHWIYFGDMHKDVGKCVGEAVDAANRFGLTGYIELLDRKLISICNSGNMYELYKVAQKAEMLTAAKEISKFIKEILFEGTLTEKA